jgi:hypothetical protein
LDSDSVAWANCNYTINYYSTVPGAPTEISTGQTAPTSYSGTCNSSGVLSKVIVSSTNIYPAGSGWIFTVCPAITNAICYSTAPISITGTTESVSTQVNAVIVAPRVTGGIGVSAYADVEVASLPNNTYWNVTTPACRYYGASWGSCGSGSGSGYPAGTGIVRVTGGTAWGTTAELSGDATTSGSNAVTVVGLDAVPFCTGFTPTNGQNIQYTTGGSPNPCYTAATSSAATGLTQIAQTVVSGSSTATITFSGISGSYTNLWVTLSGQSNCSSGQDNIVMTLNSDTSAHYGYATMYYGNAGGGQPTGQTSLSVGYLSSSTGGNTLPGMQNIYVGDYAGTAFGKWIHAQSGNVSSGTPEMNWFEGYWSGTSAVTSLTLATTCSSADFVAGTKATLYGLK